MNLKLLVKPPLLFVLACGWMPHHILHAATVDDLTLVLGDNGMACTVTRQQMADLRPGSTLLEVRDGQASLRLQLQESADLSSWTDLVEGGLTIPLESELETRFYRFAVPE